MDSAAEERFFPALSDQDAAVVVPDWSFVETYFSWHLKRATGDDVHSGRAGVALTAFFVSRLSVSEEERELWMQRARTVGGLSLPKPKRHDGATFVTGRSGVLCVEGALLDAVPPHLVAQLLALAESVVASKEVPNELWYGRVGLLYSLLWAEDHWICDCTALRGAQLALFDRICAGCENEWTWHDKRYLGFVHGYAGLVTILVRAFRRFSVEEQQARRGAYERVLKAAEVVRKNLLPGGNLRSSVGSDRDVPVHLCHGATGAVIMFLELDDVATAEAVGECVWRRGLLRKGVGLCHGISGNGFALLLLYQRTRSDKWLSRATKFAAFAVDACKSPDSRLVLEPDDPWGLVNGIGGLVCFLAALQHALRGGSVPLRMPIC